jgi:hypothetical protein
MIRGIIQGGEIRPLDPIPSDWDGCHVVIETEDHASTEERAQIEQWYAELKALGPAQYESGEREMIEHVLAEADREAKEHVRRSWASFDDNLPAGHGFRSETRIVDLSLRSVQT